MLLASGFGNQQFYSVLSDLENPFFLYAEDYLVECPMDGIVSDVLHVTSSLERGRERSFLTVIRRNGIVEKRAAYPEGIIHLEKLLAYGQELSARGIPVVQAWLKGSFYVMPYIHAEVGQL